MKVNAPWRNCSALDPSNPVASFTSNWKSRLDLAQALVAIFFVAGFAGAAATYSFALLPLNTMRTSSDQFAGQEPK
jgi:hypothetical protein